MKTYLASISLCLFACGSDPLEPGAGNDPGAGTNTLLVEGRASAEARISDAKRPTDFDVELRVRISLAGQPVTTGTVTMTSAFVTVPLTFEQIDNAMGEWVGNAGSYDQVYQLDVISGPDEVTGVIVDGPDIHAFAAPLAGASLDSTIQNELRWAREDVADLATFRTDGIDRITIPDTGSYMMGVGMLDAEQDQAVTRELELRRSNHVAPAGAVAGSDFAVTIENVLEVVVQANPAL